MLKSVARLGVIGLAALAIVTLPVQLRAQDSMKPAAETKETKARKPTVTPFHGKLKAVDKAAKTISVGDLMIQVTSETKIVKDDKPAMLEDGVAGENVSGAYKKSDDGKLNATKVTFGKKAEKAEKTETKARTETKKEKKTS